MPVGFSDTALTALISEEFVRFLGGAPLQNTTARPVSEKSASASA
jgi:hypothetical protein